VRQHMAKLHVKVYVGMYHNNWGYWVDRDGRSWYQSKVDLKLYAGHWSPCNIPPILTQDFLPLSLPSLCGTRSGGYINKLGRASPTRILVYELNSTVPQALLLDKISLNVGCCRRMHRQVFKIPVSWPFYETLAYRQSSVELTMCEARL